MSILVAKYLFDELSGQLIDHSGNGHNGTVTSNVVRGVPGIGKRSMLFGYGEDMSYVTIPSHPHFSVGEDGMTIEAVIAPSTMTFEGTPAPLCPGFPSANYITFASKCGDTSKPNPQCEWLLRMYPSEAVGGTGCPSRAERISAYIFNPAGGLGSGSYNQPVDPRAPGVYITVRAAFDPPSIPNPRVHLWVDGVKSRTSPADLYSHYGIKPTPGDAPLILGAGFTSSKPLQFRGAFNSFTVWRGVIAP